MDDEIAVIKKRQHMGVDKSSKGIKDNWCQVGL